MALSSTQSLHSRTCATAAQPHHSRPAAPPQHCRRLRREQRSSSSPVSHCSSSFPTCNLQPPASSPCTLSSTLPQPEDQHESHRPHCLRSAHHQAVHNVATHDCASMLPQPPS
ncbi:hypothetical protein SESBI_00778 [Sesbania bispinosa]|nr:hypothetical protein SESBI_00778 [Sesbania bispinosa]